MARRNSREVEYLPVMALKGLQRRARTHSGQQIAEIAKSIERFGFVVPVFVDENNNVVAGNARVAAAKTLGLTEVPCLRISGLSPSEIRAYAIADNRLAEKAGWDQLILAEELQELIDLDFDIQLTGFDLLEVDVILRSAEEASPTGNDAQDNFIPKVEAVAVSRVGDVWQLGRHTIICGDARDPAVFQALMGDSRAAMIFTDPPYNVRINGHVSGKGRKKHREFVLASGELSQQAFEKFLISVFQNAAARCRDGSIAYTCMDWRHITEVVSAGRAAFSELKNVCVWVKTNAGMGTFYRSQHEFIPVWKIGAQPHVNNFGLGDKGRYRTNVWRYAGVNTFKAGRREELDAHPTVKPVELVADAIRDVSHRGDVILDPFGGAGTTLIAAEKTGRVGRLIEVDPLYCDITIRRFERLTGKEAILFASSEAFGCVALARKNLSAKTYNGETT